MAINLANLSEVEISGNTIADYDYGIFLSSVTVPYISGNTIQIINSNEASESEYSQVQVKEFIY